MLKLQNLLRIYRSDDVETVALDSVNIHIDEGEFVAVMGPSGCGKTTLLNIIGLLDTPTRGQYEFLGQDVSDASECELGELRKHNIGFIFQNYNLIDELTVSENIELALLYRNMSTRDRRRRVADIMERMSIAHRARHLPSQLSGGQQQRVAVARAVVGGQSLILADEPTGNLDSSHGQEVMALLRELNDSGSTVLIVTHSAMHADYARRTINLFDGRVVTQSIRAVS